MAITPRVASAVELYKQLTPTAHTFNVRVELGFLIMGMTPRESDQYYAAVAVYRTALAKAAEEIEWPT